MIFTLISLGTFTFGADSPWIEPMTLIAALAVATERIKLTTSVLVAGLRSPAVLAKSVATIECPCWASQVDIPRPTPLPAPVMRMVRAGFFIGRRYSAPAIRGA